MMRRCLAIAVWLLAGTGAVAAAEIDENTGLVRAPGWEQVRIHCGGCHSHALVTAQRADRQTWLDIIRWMQATQNLWQFDAATEESILDDLGGEPSAAAKPAAGADSAEPVAAASQRRRRLTCSAGFQLQSCRLSGQYLKTGVHQ
ncbi:MAG: hypothetical protein U5K38_06320 [Woeseiaceae bacterium]|nr:hypothetical protein [Woeseiaceae bacterium]